MEISTTVRKKYSKNFCAEDYEAHEDLNKCTQHDY